MDKYAKNKAIAFGNDHANTLGVVQALGRKGISVTAALWGSKTGIVASSVHTKRIVSGSNSEECIRNIIDSCKDNLPVVIIPCCDEAAVVLEKFEPELVPDFLFQKCRNSTLKELASKDLQARLAKESGIDIPWTIEIQSVADIPEDITFPCITKPVVSTEGLTSDILVCYDRDGLIRTVENIIHRTRRLLVQQYIEKDSDYGVVGCRFSNGCVSVPDIITRTDLYPPKTGLGTVYSLDVLNDDHIKEGIISFLEKIDYVGLFSFEYAKSKLDGKYYFIEANFRNDGENPCLVKAGLNIHYAHYCDLIGEAFDLPQIHSHTAISEVRHFRSLTHRNITLKKWISDLRSKDSFMSYYPEDKGPFRRIVGNLFLSKFHLRKNESY